MSATQTAPLHYITIPPITDLTYWRVEILDNKTRLFTPVDTERHRRLLIEARKHKYVTRELPQRRRYDVHLKNRNFKSLEAGDYTVQVKAALRAGKLHYLNLKRQ